ncbi:tetratricopeptide repeat protein [Acinetobacter sp. MD2(2019)]|uniref:tetratricopeptide repeat protein n=1 Tax=Acinetobacter sp. MD2(2019) TaxID=2605273 RepID=UPI002D1E5CA9|nr:tetratricopeptide repeat protein [Acinetobacter sp. MD2(2019)]MEB3754105.1 tetratricopeptide repeat protein [Acinetobacter sp. MD2(2019)]
MRLKFILGLSISTVLVGCNSLSTQKVPTPTAKSTTSEATEKKPVNGVTTTPYNPGEIKRTPVSPTVIAPKQVPPKQDDGAQLPAYKQIIGKAQTALSQKKYAEAERFATQAQRISPQAAQSYVVLAQSALSQQKYAQAKSLALRGLSLSSDNATQAQLSQIQQQANAGK